MKNTELIERCQRGEKDSLTELYRIYSKNALGTAYLIAGNKGIADDIVQETFIQCFLSIKKLIYPETFEVWFYRILLRTGWRMAKKHNEVIPTEDGDIERITNALGSDSEIHGSENKIIISHAPGKLSLPLKSVVVLHYYNDMTIEEITEVLGCFPGTVKSRLHNAKKKLYRELSGTFSDDRLNDNPVLKRGV